MRILVVSQYFWPENFRVNDLVAELSKRGHQVTVLTGYPNYPDGNVFPAFRDDPSKFDRFQGAEVVRVPLIPRQRGGVWLLLNYASFAVTASTIGVWKLRWRKFDAVFANQLSPITIGLPAALVAFLKGAPLAMWVLDLWPDTLRALDVVRSRAAMKMIGKLVSFIYNRCDLILAQSRGFMPVIRQYCKSRPVEYFPSWAENQFGSQGIEKATEISSKAGVFNVMFAGNIGDSQGFPPVLEAAEILKPEGKVRWLIVGDGRRADWLRKEIARRDLTDCMIMLGQHPLEKMPSFYLHADAMLVCLKKEPIFSLTIPGKLQSYLAAGMPIVAMLDGEGAEVVRRSKAGLTCPAGDAQGLANAVSHLASLSSEELKVLGVNAREFSLKEFDRAALIARLEAWFENLRDGKLTTTD